MTQIKYLLFGAFAIILVISSQQVDALKCWSCITGIKKACGEPFEPSKLHNKLDYQDCSWQCGTLIYNNSEGIKSFSRFCAHNQTDLDDKCKMMNKISCETCSTDGCNTAVKYGPIALFVIIPMAVAKFFLF